MQLDRLDHVAIAVADVKRSAAWYVEVLGFEPMHEGRWGGVPTFVGVGGTGLALFPQKEGGPESLERGVLHVAFRTTRESFLSAQRELKSRGIIFDFEDHDISHSVYFCDPDGHHLELTTYELE